MPSKLRKNSDYAPPEVNEDVETDYKASKGIKKYCIFNDLDNYNIFQNCTVDVMHDCNEGIIPFFIQTFFNFIANQRILSVSKLQQIVRDFNYGFVWKKYKPTLINLKKRNLGQNSMQNYCLMIHLPFILIYSMEKLTDVWNVMITLLDALQIIYSSRIRESDIIRLEISLQQHLSYLLEKMNVKLTPKHHFTTHYANLITKTGPLIHAWMMRFESKHKDFTDTAKRTNNFKNLAKTLATRNQEQVHAIRKLAFKFDVVKSMQTYNVLKSEDFEQFECLISHFITDDALSALLSLSYGSFQYRAGLMVIDNNKRVFEIIHVIPINEHNLLICREYDLLQFNFNFHSIEIKKNDVSEYKLLDIDLLENKKTYDRIFCQNRSYIIADTLDVYDKL